MRLRLLSTRDLVEISARPGNRRGMAKLRRVIAEGLAPTRSPLEDVALDLIKASGLEDPDVNVHVTWDQAVGRAPQTIARVRAAGERRPP